LKLANFVGENVAENEKLSSRGKFDCQQIVLILKIIGNQKTNLLKLANFVGENVAENEKLYGRGKFLIEKVE
jgi:predicted ester cyclase